jgi:hypothetical protein
MRGDAGFPIKAFGDDRLGDSGMTAAQDAQRNEAASKLIEPQTVRFHASARPASAAKQTILY